MPVRPSLPLLPHVPLRLEREGSRPCDHIGRHAFSFELGLHLINFLLPPSPFRPYTPCLIGRRRHSCNRRICSVRGHSALFCRRSSFPAHAGYRGSHRGLLATGQGARLPDVLFSSRLTPSRRSSHLNPRAKATSSFVPSLTWSSSNLIPPKLSKVTIFRLSPVLIPRLRHSVVRNLQLRWGDP